MSAPDGMKAADIVCLVFLALNSVTDIKSRRIWWPGCLLMACAGLLAHLPEGTARLPALALSLLPGAAMAALSFLFQGSLGLGDALVVMACGFLTEPEAVLGMLLHALLLAGGYAFFLLAVRKKGRKDAFPFVPFLLAGMILSELSG